MTEAGRLADEAGLVCLSCHRLFNMINNSYCLRLLDVRSEEKYTLSRIRNSMHINSSEIDSTKESIDALVEKQKGVFGIILVFDEQVDVTTVCQLKGYISTQHEAALLVDPAPEDILAKNWKRLDFVDTINCTHFYQVYGRCDTLFDGATNPPMPGFKGRNRYFASEIIPDLLYLGMQLLVLIL